MIKEILVADDFSNDSKLGYLRSSLLQGLGAELAKRLKTRLRLLYVVDVPKKYFKQDEILIGPDTKRLERLPVKSKVDVANGKPVDTLLKEDKANNLEMLVLGTRGHRGIQKAILGSVSEEVLRNSQHPVMVLGPAALDKKFQLKSSGKLKLLVVTDLTEASESAERYAMQLAKTLSAQVVLVHSVGDSIRKMKDMIYTQRYVSPSIDRIFDEMVEFAEESMEKKVKAFKTNKIKVEAFLSYRERDVVKELEDSKWHGCDMVVMGTHGRNKFMKAFLGSTARKMILKSAVPVIVVRSR